MTRRLLSVWLVGCLVSNIALVGQSAAQESQNAADDQWWSQQADDALVLADENRDQLVAALKQVPEDQRAAMDFLIANMPQNDLQSLSAEFLLENVSLSYEARARAPWGKDIPEDIFLNDVVAYCNVNEKREAWRAKLGEMCWPLVKDCKTAAEAAQALNEKLFPLVNVRYSTKRKRPDQAPSESIEQGLASCTGLSILLSDACRSVCVPARLAGTPLWTNKRGNHTWVEIWDGQWHFAGACEPSKNGLNHGWFVADAAQGQADSRLHSIYASSFRKTDTYFPLVWDRRNTSVPAVNVTEYYNDLVKPKAEQARLMIKLVGVDGTRLARGVTVSVVDADKSYSGTTRGREFRYE